MDINSIGFNGINKVGLNKAPKNKVVNFSGSDIISFSEATKVRRQTIKDLEEVGYTSEEANGLINKYSKTDAFKELTEGIGEGEEWMSGHNIEQIYDRNLTHAEAILYLEYPMEDYYIQHSDFPSFPMTYIASSQSAQDYKIGNADFLPTDLAKQIKKGFSLEVAGMILKGKITEEQAKRMQPFYDETGCDKYHINTNVQQSEYTINKIIQNLDKAETLISEEKDEQGNFVSGLARPLTHREATALITEDYMPQDTDSINKFLELNNRFGYSIFDMSIENLWGKTVEDIEKEQEVARAKQLEREKNKPTGKEIKTIDDAIAVVRYKYQHLAENEYDDFFSDLSQLDSEKFLKKLSPKQIKFDAMQSFLDKREERQANIKAMNLMSLELIDKITQTDEGEKGKFATLRPLFEAKDLESKVRNMEEFRVASPQLFANMTKESVLDYLTGTTFFSDTKKSHDEFLDIVYASKYGIPMPEENNHPETKIFEFPKKDEE